MNEAFTWWAEHVRAGLELLSFIAIIGTAPMALIELRSHFREARESAMQQRLEAARAAYREVDDKFNSFLSLCLAHPRLDCFSTPQECLEGITLTAEELQQQRLLYTLLIDVCEVSFVEYHSDDTIDGDDPVGQLYRGQWDGWEAYIRKFMTRPAFRTVWAEIADEYDPGFRTFMDGQSRPA